MKTAVKMFLSALIVLGFLLFAQYLPIVVIGGILLVFIWDNPLIKKSKEESHN